MDREFQIIENDALETHFDLAMAEVRVLVLLGLRECRCAWLLSVVVTFGALFLGLGILVHLCEYQQQEESKEEEAAEEVTMTDATTADE